MSFASMLTQTAAVTHTAPGTTDAEGQWLPGTQTTTPYPCRAEQVTAEEKFDQGIDQSVTVFRLFLLPNAVIAASDLVVVDGDQCEVDGRPDVLRTPRGPHHIEARLRLISG